MGSEEAPIKGGRTEPASAGVLAAHGGAIEGGLFQSCYLAAPGGRIAAGTEEILRNIIAERVLGLPGDIRIDRDVAFHDIPARH